MKVKKQCSPRHGRHEGGDGSDPDVLRGRMRVAVHDMDIRNFLKPTPLFRRERANH